MRCAICGIQIDSVDEAVEAGWTPYFYDDKIEHEVACPSCTEALLQEGMDGEMQLKEEYRGKRTYLDEIEHKFWQDDSEVVMAVLENEPGELN